MQQTLVGCAFCDAPPGAEVGEAHIWGQDERVTHRSALTVPSRWSRIPTNAIMSPVTAVGWSSTRSQRRQRFTLASSGTNGPARLTRFRVELGHLEGSLQLYERCSSGGLATYWTRGLKEHFIATPTE